MLSQSELDSLQYHGTNHYFVKKMKPDYQAIATWYDSIPDPTLNNLACLLSPSDRKLYMAQSHFPTWYSNLCEMIELNTTIKLNKDSNTLYTNEEIDDISINLFLRLIELGMTEHTVQRFMIDAFRRDKSVLNNFLLCLGFSGIFSEYTLFLLNIDMSPLKRWESLGLSGAPTESECQLSLS